MFSKLKLKTLIILFIILLGVVVIYKLVESRRGDRSFRSQLITFESTDVTRIDIVSDRGGKEQLALLKYDKAWRVEKDGKQYSADKTVVESVLNELINLKPLRVAATNESMWEKLEVTDSLGVRVTVKGGKNVLSELIIGKFSYKKPSNPYQQQGTMMSYVRPSDDEKVYVVNGFLNMTFSRELNTYRDKLLINSPKEDWTKLSFSSPSSLSFTLIKQNEKWMIDGLLADSVKVQEYFTEIDNLRSYNFVDKQSDASFASNTLVIEGNNMQSPIEIKAFPADSTHQYIITSSINKETYFSGANGGLFNKIFVNKDKFTK